MTTNAKPDSPEALQKMFTRAVNNSKYSVAIDTLIKLPKDVVLESLVCWMDEVKEERKMPLLEALNPELADDGEILGMLGLW